MEKEIITAKDCLDALTEEERKELAADRKLIEFQAGETIIKKGFVAGSIMLLEEGLAKLNIESFNKPVTVSLVTPQSFIGIVCTFASHNFSFSSVAIEKTKVSLFDIRLFEKFIKQNGQFACHIIKHMSVITNRLVHTVSQFSHKNINGSLSILLMEFSRIYNKPSFVLPLNRKDLANMIGYSKESVINALSKFNKEGLLKVHDKHIEILDKEKLIKIGQIG